MRKRVTILNFDKVFSKFSVFFIVMYVYLEIILDSADIMNFCV